MEWYNFNDKVPPFNERILVYSAFHKDLKDISNHWITGAVFTLEGGLKLDGQRVGDKPLMWSFMPEPPVI